jgi:hypothetical protein
LPTAQPDKANRTTDNVIAIDFTTFVYLVLNRESTDYQQVGFELSGNVRQLK